MTTSPPLQLSATKKMPTINIGQTATINLGIAATIVLTGASLLWKVSQATSKFEMALTTSDARTAALEDSTRQLDSTVRLMAKESQEFNMKINKLMDDRFTLSMATEMAFRNAIRNPGISFSDPRSPDKVISVPVAPK